MAEEQTESLDAVLQTMRDAHRKLAELRLPQLEALLELSKDPVVSKLANSITMIAPMLVDNSTKQALVSYVMALDALPKHLENCLAETKTMLIEAAK